MMMAVTRMMFTVRQTLRIFPLRHTPFTRVVSAPLGSRGYHSSNTISMTSSTFVDKSSNSNNNNTAAVIEFDQICELASSNLRFGPGSTAEVGQDLDFMNARNVIIVTDPTVERLPPMQVLQESLDRHNINYKIFNQVRVEPNDVSFQNAINYFQNYKSSSGRVRTKMYFPVWIDRGMVSTPVRCTS